MTAPISVEPAALAAIGTTVGGEGNAIAATVGSLDSSLSGAGAMFGHDAAGVAFAQSYTASGKALLDAATSAVNACRRVGFGVQVSAANYGHANASSTVGGGITRVPVPTAPGQFSAPAMPPPFGDGIVAPLAWGLVEAFVGDVWPDGNPGELRAAAGAWRSFGSAVSGLAGQVQAAGPALSAQQIPEAGQMAQALGQIGGGLTEIASEAQTLATAVDGFAGTVEATQNAIRGLLHQLSPAGVLETIGGIFTGHNPIDEVKKIALEIKTVLDNMKREADASGQLFSQGINMLDSATNSLETWAKKEFTNAFGQDVGGMLSFGFTAMVDESEGAVKFVAETAEGIKQFDPTRFAYDPSGAAKTWEGLGESAALLTNPALLAAKVVNDPQGSLDTVKGLVDWKDVEAGHPFRALGYDGAQVATAFIPGVGEAEPAVIAGEVEGRAALASAETEGRVATGASREAAPGLAGASAESKSIASQAGRVSSDLDGIKVPESSSPAGAGPGSSAPSERAPVTTAPPSADVPGGRAPADSLPSHVPGAEPVPERPAPEPHSPPVSDSAPPVAPQRAEPVPAHADPPPPSHSSSPAQIAEGDPSRPPPGGGSYESAPAAGESSRPLGDSGTGSQGGDVAAPAGADDKVPVSVGAHAGEPGEGATGSGHGSGGGSGGSGHGSDGGSGHGGNDHSSSTGDDHSGHDEAGPDSGHQSSPPTTENLRDLRPWDLERIERAIDPNGVHADLYEHNAPADLAESAADSPYSGMSPTDILERYWDPQTGTWDWPLNDGFRDGQYAVAHAIPEGLRLDRIGLVEDWTGDFMSTAGDSYPSRSLAPGTSGDYHLFEGTGEPLPPEWQLRYGEAGPAFDQPGGSTQWVVVDEEGNHILIDQLLIEGYLRRVH